ncbi:MAG: hypothetical protein ACK53F_05125 [Betaproteobacteria bacterium]
MSQPKRHINADITYKKNTRKKALPRLIARCAPTHASATLHRAIEAI